VGDGQSEGTANAPAPAPVGVLAGTREFTGSATEKEEVRLTERRPIDRATTCVPRAQPATFNKG
jgi:hypothetical protein